jgi:hypothetical protein
LQTNKLELPDVPLAIKQVPPAWLDHAAFKLIRGCPHPTWTACSVRKDFADLLTEAFAIPNLQSSRKEQQEKL